MPNEEPQAQRPAPVDLRQLRRLIFAKVKLPGWLLIAFAIFNLVPDVKSRIDFWSDMIRSAGSHLSVLAAFVQSIYFPITLGVFGLIYIVFVGEPVYTARSRLLPYLGWAIFGICCAAVVSVSIAGAFEYAVRKEVASRQATVLHDGTNPQSQQLYDPNFNYRRALSADQFRQLVAQSYKLKPYAKDMSLAMSSSTDGEVYTLQGNFADAFRRAGIQPKVTGMEPNDPSENGVMIVVANKANMPEGAKTLERILEVAGIMPKVITRPLNSEKFVLFIGPKPI